MKRWVNLPGRNMLIEHVRYREIRRELESLQQNVLSVTNGTAGLAPKNGRWFAQGSLPARENPSQSMAFPAQQLASLDTKPGFVIDYDFVYSGDPWDFQCFLTYVISDECHLSGVGFEPGSVLKYEAGASLYVEGDFYFYGGGSCNGTTKAILTSVDDDSVGETIPWSSGSPSSCSYGPALAVQPDDFSTAQQAVLVSYGCPDIVALGPNVTVTASDAIATKGTADVGKFVIARESGDWSQSLPVSFSVAGTATSGTDYTAIGTTATIPQNVGSVEITVTPASQGGTIHDSTVILTLQSGFGYTVDSPSLAIVTIYDPSVPPPGAPITAPSGLVAWWRGENNAFDSVAANHGSLLNGVGFGYGKSARGFIFDGVDDRVTVNDNSVLDVGANADYPIEAWIKPDVANSAYGVQVIVDKRYTPNDWTATGYTLHLINGQLGCQMAVGGSPANFGQVGPELRDGAFHHVAVSIDRDSTSGLKFYVDGQQVGQSLNPTGKQGDMSNTQPFRIGNHASASLNAHMTGVIDEVSLYNRALSATEIQDIYNAGAGGKFLPDTDSDSLPDGWETSYWGNTTSQSGADDADGDGLTNLQEYQMGTNPITADTGSTGTTDAYKDADADGLTNLEEFQLGKNPLVPNVAPLTFSPRGGDYGSAQEVTIASPTASAIIRHTTDGNEPTEGLTPDSTATINASATLKAKAWKSGWTPSDTETQGYRINESANSPPTVTVSPSGSVSFLASDSIEFLVEAEDSDGAITKVQLYRGNYKVAETTSSVLRHTVANVPSGTYTFTAKAIDDFGAVTVSSPVTLTIAASGPVVSLMGVQPFFTSSPGMLIARITGVNPGGLSTLTLNGGAITKRSGEFTIPVTLTEGANTFTLLANGTASASTTVYLDSTAPTIAITAPANNTTFNTTRVNVSGTFTESSLKQITVNGVLAFMGSGTFTAFNVPLATGANSITAVAEDIAGNSTSTSINLNGDTTLADPVQLAASPLGGFATLNVTFTPTASSAPGTLQNVFYDFDGNGTTDQTESNLNPVSHNYTAGEYFPVVTVQTTTGKFSSLGGWNSTTADRLRINVQSAPTAVSAISITDPVDLKTTANGHLYVLSRSTATITEYDASHAIVRSKSSLGTTPTGLDVDADGNVYVALSGQHQVAKYNPNGGTFQLDTSFDTDGIIGSSGAGNGQFSTPYDVAVSLDGTEIAVSDSGNHRIQQFSTANGAFLGLFGSSGSGVGQFNTPKGLTFDDSGYLYIVDSGNNRIVLALSSAVFGMSGSSGAALGQFQKAVNLGVGPRGIYVAETYVGGTGNDRVQAFDPTSGGHGVSPTPFNARLSLSTQLGLSQPNAVVPIADFLAEKIYIADTGNNRVIKATLSEASAPDAGWGAMRTSLINGDIAGAIPYFASASAERYREAFLSIGASDLIDIASSIPATLIPIYIENETAQYRFEQDIVGRTLSFPVKLVKENGAWKIVEF